MGKLNFKRIITTAVILFITIIAAVSLVIFGYALLLGFKAQGAPDNQKIMEFAGIYAPIITVAGSILFTFLACLWTSRKVRNKAALHGLFIAAFAALLLIISGLIFKGKIWHDLLAGFTMILSGYLGTKTGKYLFNSAASSNSAESQNSRTF